MGDALGVKFVLRVDAGGGYITPAGQLTGDLSRSSTTAEVTDKDSDNWEESIAGIRSWEMTASFNFDDTDSGYQALRDAYHNQSTLTADIHDTEASKYHRGTVNVTELTLSAPKDEAATYSVTLKGTSTLSNL